MRYSGKFTDAFDSAQIFAELTFLLDRQAGNKQMKLQENNIFGYYRIILILMIYPDIFE